MTRPSRGFDIRNYIPALSKGAVIPLACLSAGFITGVSAKGITSAYIGDASIHSVMVSAKAITSAKIRAAFLSGTLVSGKVVFAIAHGLGVKPKMVLACSLNTLTEASAAQNNHVSLAISASTSANIYLIASGTKAAAHKYMAFVLL